MSASSGVGGSGDSTSTVAGSWTSGSIVAPPPVSSPPQARSETAKVKAKAKAKVEGLRTHQAYISLAGDALENTEEAGVHRPSERSTVSGARVFFGRLDYWGGHNTSSCAGWVPASTRSAGHVTRRYRRSAELVWAGLEAGLEASQECR